MAKIRNKKKRNGAAPMDISAQTAIDLPQAMETSESAAAKSELGVINRKIKKAPTKRSKSLRKMKAKAKAISQSEKSEEKISKIESKISRTQSAKLLYD